MIVFAVKIRIRKTLKNYIYQFNNKMYQQMEGAAIGVGLVREVANLFMVWWDRKVRSRLTAENREVALYSRYVDNIGIAAKSILTDENEKERVAMEAIQKVSNSIHPSIRVTIDFPSAHPNKSLPVLDIEQWIEKVDVNGEMKSQILHSHYMKSMIIA